MKRLTVAVCVDDRLGMMFNKRRQSRDSVLIDELIRSTSGRIFIHPYSSALFANKERICISETPLSDAEGGDVCFIENMPLLPHLNDIETLIIYKWNRTYPFDMKLDIDTELLGFNLISESEFEGSSHEKITKGIYRR